MNYFEKKPLNYIIAAKFYYPIQRLIAGNENWILLDDEIEICEKQYQAKEWEAVRRMVIILCCAKIKIFGIKQMKNKLQK